MPDDLSVEDRMRGYAGTYVNEDKVLLGVNKKFGKIFKIQTLGELSTLLESLKQEDCGCHFDLDSVERSVREVRDEQLSHSFNIAVKKNNIDLVKLLFSTRCKLGNSYLSGKNLLVACKKNYGALGAFLASNDAKVNFCLDFEGDRPLHYACKNGNHELVELLLVKGADVNALNLKKNTPLYYACKVGNDKLIKILLTGGADANAINSKEETPLLCYCSHRPVNSEVANLFVNVIDVNENFKSYVLSWEWFEKNFTRWVNLALFLLKNGADPTITNNDYTILHFCAMTDNLELLKLSVDRGAKIDAPDYYGRTPLHIACDQKYMSIEVIEYLLDQGADINIVNKNGNTPLQSLYRYKYNNVLTRKSVDVVALCLRKKLIDINSIFRLILRDFRRLYVYGMKGVLREGNILAAHVDLVKFLLKNGADPIVIDDDLSIYHYACIMGDIELLKLFVGCGANLKVVDKFDKAPLDIARSYDNTEIVKYLLEIIDKKGSKIVGIDQISCDITTDDRVKKIDEKNIKNDSKIKMWSEISPFWKNKLYNIIIPLMAGCFVGAVIVSIAIYLDSINSCYV